MVWICKWVDALVVPTSRPWIFPRPSEIWSKSMTRSKRSKTDWQSVRAIWEGHKRVGRNAVGPPGAMVTLTVCWRCQSCVLWTVRDTRHAVQEVRRYEGKCSEARRLGVRRSFLGLSSIWGDEVSCDFRGFASYVATSMKCLSGVTYDDQVLGFVMVILPSPAPCSPTSTQIFSLACFESSFLNSIRFHSILSDWDHIYVGVPSFVLPSKTLLGIADSNVDWNHWTPTVEPRYKNPWYKNTLIKISSIKIRFPVPQG